MNKLACTILPFVLLGSFEASAQKDPVYYTDSDVKRSRVVMGLHYDPLFTQRRIVQFQDDAGQGTDEFPATGGYGDMYGVHFDFRINSGLMVGLGYDRANIRYRLDNYTIHHEDLPGDSARTNLSIYGQYNSFPLRIGFVSPMNEIWDLEIWVPLTYHVLSSYGESADYQGQTYEFDRTDVARKALWSVGIMVGGAYHFADNWAFALHGQFRYMTNTMYEDDSRPQETPYAAGISVGLRYHF